MCACGTQSIYQDDPEVKGKGVESLIHYTTLCKYMLVPTEERELTGHAATYPEFIPNYGERGWCRAEYFIFSLSAEMQETVQDVQLYAMTTDGRLHQYPKVNVLGDEYMPSGGDLTNPDDRKLIKGLEETILDAYGKAVVVKECRKGGSADLSGKMLRQPALSMLTKDVMSSVTTLK